jgi:hypothetical protein
VLADELTLRLWSATTPLHASFAEIIRQLLK